MRSTLLWHCSIAAAAALPLHAQAPLLSTTRPGFEVHAPSAAALEVATTAAEQAAREFERYMGTPAPRFALVTYDTEAQRAAFQPAEFQERGIPLLRWPALSPLPGGFTGWEELGVILGRGVDDRVHVRSVYETGSPPALRTGDVLVAVNGQPVRSLRDFGQVRMGLPRGAQVALEVERAGARTTLTATPAPVSTRPPAAALQAAANAGPRVPTSRAVLAHEMGHVLLDTHLQGQRVAAWLGAKVPSWFNEGFASLMEEPEAREARRRLVRESAMPVISLQTLLTMPHPATAGVAARDSVVPKSADRGPMQVVVRRDPRAPGGDLFYGQSLLLLEFLAERRGPRFIGELARELTAGKTLEQALGSADLAALEREWLAWMDAPARTPSAT